MSDYEVLKDSFNKAKIEAKRTNKIKIDAVSRMGVFITGKLDDLAKNNVVTKKPLYDGTPEYYSKYFKLKFKSAMADLDVIDLRLWDTTKDLCYRTSGTMDQMIKALEKAGDAERLAELENIKKFMNS